MSQSKVKIPKDQNAEPKKRGRAKKQKPTKEEALKLLMDAINDIKQNIQELKEDEARISSMGLKRLPELAKEELEDLQEDLQEVEAEYEEMKNGPDCE